MATQYAGGPIVSIPVTAGGTGYSSTPTVVLAGVGSGFGATFTVNFSGGSVTSITVTAGGHCYPFSGITATISGGGGSGATLGAVVVSSGDVNTTFTNDGTKQNIINSLETALLAAGWTTISGHATTNLLMQTHATPYPLQANFRFKDNGGTSVQISIENTAGTVTGANTTSNFGASISPANGHVFRIIANPYQFCILMPGTYTTNSTFAYGGVPYVPSFLSGITAAGLLVGNAGSDGDNGTYRGSWRIYNVLNTGNNLACFEVLWNTSIWNNTGGNPNAAQMAAMPNFLIPMFASIQAIGQSLGTYCQPYRWAGNQVHSCDPLMSWGLTGTTDEPQIRGQLWDMTLVLDSYAGDLTSSWDNHNWFAITNLNGGNAQYNARSTLFVVTP